MTKTYIQKANEDRNEHRLFQREWSNEAVTGLLCEEMERQGVTRAQLADRLGVTRSAVTQLLDVDNNKSVYKLSDAFFELDQSLEFHCRPLKEVTDGQPIATSFANVIFKSFSVLDVGYSPMLTKRSQAYLENCPGPVSRIG